MTELLSAHTPSTVPSLKRLAYFGCIFLSFLASQTLSQTLVPASDPAEPPAVAASPVQSTNEQPSASTPAQTAAPAPTVAAPVKRWQKLSERQKQALSPLREQWDGLPAQQRNKWLSIADTFLQLTDEEQMTMHGRMNAWARLSAKERNAARFNFNSTQSLAIDDKRAQWEAYQALPDQEKQQLSSGPKPPAKSAARTTQPAVGRLVSPPALPVNTPKAIPRVAPSQPIDPKTLLPKPKAQSARSQGAPQPARS